MERCHFFLLFLAFQEIPQQMNGSDCGMFACKYADCITKDRPINFTQVSQAFRRELYEHPVSRLPDRCFSLHLLHLGALLQLVAHNTGGYCLCRLTRKRVVIGHILGYHISHIVMYGQSLLLRPSLPPTSNPVRSRELGPEQVSYSFPLFG